MLKRVGLREPERALAAYPHEFSGGMRQRIMLASVMLLKPALLIADEPTTALDAVVQRDVMELMVELTKAEGTAVLLISHDLPMVARYTNRFVVMEKGVIVEAGHDRGHSERTGASLYPQAPVFAAVSRRHRASSTCPARRWCRPATSWWNILAAKGSSASRRRSARFTASASTSMSAKSSPLSAAPARARRRLAARSPVCVQETEGEILFQGRERSADWRDYRLNCQMVFQDPYSSLDPRMTIQALVEEALRLVPDLDGAAKRKRALETLEEVGLSGDFASRYPHELSGGQRQRVAIARAIARRPKFLIADEPVSALDVTVRAQVLELFSDLQKRYGFSCLFISHDLGVVEQVADRVIVMQDGRIVEQGDRDRIFDQPQEAYTRKLLSAIPALDLNHTGGVTLKWRLEA